MNNGETSRRQVGRLFTKIYLYNMCYIKNALQKEKKIKRQVM